MESREAAPTRVPKREFQQCKVTLGGGIEQQSLGSSVYLLIYFYVCVNACVSCTYEGARGRQKRTSSPLELELQAVSILGTKLGSSVRAASTLYH